MAVKSGGYPPSRWLRSENRPGVTAVAGESVSLLQCELSQLIRISRSAIVRSAVQTGQKYAGRFANSVGDHRALVELQIKRKANELMKHLQLLSERYQLFRRQAAMSLTHSFGQRVGNPRAPRTKAVFAILRQAYSSPFGAVSSVSPSHSGGTSFWMPRHS
jgi:hypothetical protein